MTENNFNEIKSHTTALKLLQGTLYQKLQAEIKLCFSLHFSLKEIGLFSCDYLFVSKEVKF